MWYDYLRGTYSEKYLQELDKHLEVFLNTPGMKWEEYMKLRDNRKVYS